MVTIEKCLLPRNFGAMTLKLILDDEIEFDEIECADCGEEVLHPAFWDLPYEIERYICSTCWAVRAEDYRKKQLLEAHRPIGEQPPARDILAPQKGETLELFKK